MSPVRVAIPLFRGKRCFYLEKGRRWSVAEHLLLAALVEQPGSASGLAAAAGGIPRRLVLEMLIRLMRAGWVELKPDGSTTIFQATDAGRIAAARAELPVVARPLSRWMNFVVDRITGTIFRPREMPFLHRNAIRERATREPVVWLEPCQLDAHFEVQDLVSNLFQEDETFVAIEPSGDRLMERYGLVLVRGTRIEGLPERAPEALTEAVREAAAAHAKPPLGIQTVHVLAPSESPDVRLPEIREATVRDDDLIVGAQQTDDALRQLIASARYRLIIHSTFVSEAAFARLKPELIAAAKRGARVDLLWGEGEDARSSGRTRAAVSKLREELARSGEDELIRLHPFSTRSHAKFVIADRNGGSPAALLGSCNWLSSGMRLIETTIRLRDAALVGDLLFQAAELSRGRDGHWTDLTSELAAYAAALAKPGKSMPQPGQPTAQLILGPQHKPMVLRAIREAQTRVVVTSHRISVAARQALLVPLCAAAAAPSAEPIKRVVAYGHEPAQGEPDWEQICAGLAMTEIETLPHLDPQLHAKVLGWDDDNLLITSQNWLSADPSDANWRREIGVHLRVPGIANRFWHGLANAYAAPSSEEE